MKRNTLLLVLVVLVFQSLAQDTTRPAPTKADYLRKSKSKKTAGWILLGSGLGMLAGSAATYKMSFGYSFGGPATPSRVDNTASTFLGIGGGIATIVSIISFSSANKNKRKAASLTIGNEHIPLLQQHMIVSRMQQTIRLRIPL